MRAGLHGWRVVSMLAQRLRLDLHRLQHYDNL